MTDIRKKLERKKADFKRFDALPLEERKRLTAQGCNPHESEVVRQRKQQLLHREIKLEVAENKRLSKRQKERLFKLLNRGRNGKRISTESMDAIHPEDQNDII